MEGEFAAAHVEDIRHLARNLEERQKKDHPLKRIMRMEVSEGDDAVLEIATTDVHLARTIGDALHHAYQGELDYHYTEAEDPLRVFWRR